MSKNLTIVSWIARIVAAGILGMAAFTKLTGQETAVDIFEVVGLGSAGRMGIGAAEAIAVILLLVPKTAVFGGIVGIGLMIGAIGSHLFTDLGIKTKLPNVEGMVDGDGGGMFVMAIVTLIVCAVIVFLHKGQLLKKQ